MTVYSLLRMAYCLDAGRVVGTETIIVISECCIVLAIQISVNLLGGISNNNLNNSNFFLSGHFDVILCKHEADLLFGGLLHIGIDFLSVCA